MGNPNDVTVTQADYHADQIGRAVLAAIRDLDAEVWFDVGCALAADERVRRAVKGALDPRVNPTDSLEGGEG